jgi:hypothetical protein
MKTKNEVKAESETGAKTNEDRTQTMLVELEAMDTPESLAAATKLSTAVARDNAAQSLVTSTHKEVKQIRKALVFASQFMRQMVVAILGVVETDAPALFLQLPNPAESAHLTPDAYPRAVAKKLQLSGGPKMALWSNVLGTVADRYLITLEAYGPAVMTFSQAVTSRAITKKEAISARKDAEGFIKGHKPVSALRVIVPRYPWDRKKAPEVKSASSGQTSATSTSSSTTSTSTASTSGSPPGQASGTTT